MNPTDVDGAIAAKLREAFPESAKSVTAESYSKMATAFRTAILPYADAQHAEQTQQINLLQTQISTLHGTVGELASKLGIAMSKLETLESIQKAEQAASASSAPSPGVITPAEQAQIDKVGSGLIKNYLRSKFFRE